MKIYYPKDIHLYTIILLHGLYSDYSSFDNLVSKLRNLSNNIKIIVPNAPIRNIDWPYGREYNVRSWYNYFTCNNGKLNHDIIDIRHFKNESTRIYRIIIHEVNIIKPENIILIGESQGGTIVSGLSLQLEKKIGAFILLDSVYMDNILKVNNVYNNIYIYSSEKDEIYKIQLQKESIERLKIKKYIIDWYIDKDITHCQNSPNRDNFIIIHVKNIFRI